MIFDECFTKIREKHADNFKHVDVINSRISDARIAMNRGGVVVCGPLRACRCSVEPYVICCRNSAHLQTMTMCSVCCIDRGGVARPAGRELQ